MADSAGALSLVVLSGQYERVHYALAMAAAALAINRPVTLFFTNRALLALRRSQGETPGWHGLAEDEEGRPAALQDAIRRQAGVAGLDELLEACVELGVRLIACETGLRTIGLQASDLRDDFKIEVAGLVTLYVDLPPEGKLLVL